MLAESIRKLRNFNVDEVSTALLQLIETHTEELKEHFDKDVEGVSSTRFVSILMPYVCDDFVPLFPKFFSTTDAAHVHLQLLYQRLDVQNTNSVTWGDFYDFVCHSRRKMHKIPPRRCATYFHMPELESPFVRGINDSAPLTNDAIDKLYCLTADAKLQVLQASTLQTLNPSVDGIKGHPTAVETIAQHSVYVVSTRSNVSHLTLFDAATDKFIGEFETSNDDVRLRWHDDAQQLVAGSSIGELVFWELQRGRFLSQISTAVAHSGSISEILECGLSYFVASSGLSDGHVALTNMERALQVRSVKAHQFGVSAMAYDPTTHCFVTGGVDDNKPRVWPGALGGGSIAELWDNAQPHQFAVCSVKCLPDAYQFLTLDVKGMVKVWDTRMHACVQTLPSVVKSTEQKVSEWKHLGLIPKFPTVISCNTTKLSAFGAAGSDDLTNVIAADSFPITHICSNPEDNTIITGAKSNLKVWSALNGELQMALNDAIADEVTALTVDEAGRRIFIGTSSGDVSCHHYSNGYVSMRYKAHKAPVRNVLLCTLGAGGFNATSPPLSPATSANATEALSASPSGGSAKEDRFIITYGDDKRLRLTWTCIAGSNTNNSVNALLLGDVECRFLHLDTRFDKFVVGGNDGLLRVWDIADFARENFATTTCSVACEGEQNGNDSGSTPAGHTFNVMKALRNGVVPQDGCLLTERGTMLLADGADMSVIACSAAQAHKASRLCSWASVSGQPVHQLEFVHRSHILVAWEDAESKTNCTIGIYSFEDLMKSLQSESSTFLDSSSAPSVLQQLRPFDAVRISAMHVLSNKPVILVAGDNTQCLAFSMIGEGIGKLDVTNQSAHEWKAGARGFVAAGRAVMASKLPDLRKKKAKKHATSPAHATATVQNKYNLQLHAPHAPIIAVTGRSQSAPSTLPFCGDADEQQMVTEAAAAKRSAALAALRRQRSGLRGSPSLSPLRERKEVSHRSGREVVEEHLKTKQEALEERRNEGPGVMLPCLRLATVGYNPPKEVVEMQRLAAQQRFNLTTGTATTAGSPHPHPGNRGARRTWGNGPNAASSTALSVATSSSSPFSPPLRDNSAIVSRNAGGKGHVQGGGSNKEDAEGVPQWMRTRSTQPRGFHL